MPVSHLLKNHLSPHRLFAFLRILFDLFFDHNIDIFGVEKLRQTGFFAANFKAFSYFVSTKLQF